jgi:hypothetical protein
MNEVNWLLSLAVGLILSVPFGIATNLLTPRIQELLERQTITARGKTVARLKADYERIKRLHDDPTLLQLTMALYIMRGVAFLVFFIPSLFVIQLSADSTTKLLLYGVIMLAAYTTGFGTNKIVSDITRLTRFGEYEREVQNRIAQLESNLTKPKAGQGE